MQNAAPEQPFLVYSTSQSHFISPRTTILLLFEVCCACRLCSQGMKEAEKIRYYMKRSPQPIYILWEPSLLVGRSLTLCYEREAAAR
jgi:hypothetical protein